MVFPLTNIDIFHGKMIELFMADLPGCHASWDEMGMTSVMRIDQHGYQHGGSATIFIRQIT